MATKISCGATDCAFNAGKNSPGASGQESPVCTSPTIRIAPGKIGGAICFQYTNAPHEQAQMDPTSQSRQSAPMPGTNVDKALY